MAQLRDRLETDQRLDPEKNPVPFDGACMVRLTSIS
jgi:hypothetical protein